MKKTNEFVQKIKNHYVGNDCVQVMIPYQNALTIVSPDGMLYHHTPESRIYVNKYLEDERRKQFPYSNIPTHYSRILFKKFAYTNQILDFDKPYIRIGDGFWLESYAVKDNNQALLVSSIKEPIEHIKHMTYDELLKFIGSSNNNKEEIYYVSLSGGIPINNQEVIPSKEEIVITSISGNKEVKLTEISIMDRQSNGSFVVKDRVMDTHKCVSIMSQHSDDLVKSSSEVVEERKVVTNNKEIKSLKAIDDKMMTIDEILGNMEK